MDVMIDLETLGTRPGSVILSIGACTFGSGGGRRTFHVLLDMYEQVNRGMTIDPSTVMWWFKQSEQARAAQDAPRQTVSIGLALFQEWWADATDGDACVWGHGSNFDIPLTEALFDRFHMKWPWKYSKVRDTRTIFDLAGKKMGDFGTPNPLAHDALSDAIYQAAETQKCLAFIAAQRAGV